MTTGDIQTATSHAPPRLRMSYEEYYAWADEDIHAEWVDGEVIVHMPPFDIHQTLLNFLNRLLAEYIEFEGLGVVFIAPFEMRLPAQKSARQPDILVIRRENLDRLSREDWTARPLWSWRSCPEIVSGVTARRSIASTRTRACRSTG